jgi:hypothetical protein
LLDECNYVSSAETETLRPQIALARDLDEEFFSLTRRRDAAALELWWERVAAGAVVELQRYSTGLKWDREAENIFVRTDDFRSGRLS